MKSLFNGKEIETREIEVLLGQNTCTGLTRMQNLVIFLFDEKKYTPLDHYFTPENYV